MSRRHGWRSLREGRLKHSVSLPTRFHTDFAKERAAEDEQGVQRLRIARADESIVGQVNGGITSLSLAM